MLGDPTWGPAGLPAASCQRRHLPQALHPYNDEEAAIPASPVHYIPTSMGSINTSTPPSWIYR